MPRRTRAPRISAFRRRVLCIASILLAGGVACHPPSDRDHGPLADVYPSVTAPGTTAIVRIEGLDRGASPEAITVMVGNQPATVTRVDPAVGVEFLVPKLAAGPVKVQVTVARGRTVQGILEVAPSPARQLVLTMSGTTIEVISNQGSPSLARSSREVPPRQALAYDVVTAEGRIVATGTVTHPLADRLEVYDPDGGLRGAPAPATGTFTLRIPAVSKGSRIRFYQLEPGADGLAKESLTAAARGQRKLISDIELGGES